MKTRVVERYTKRYRAVDNPLPYYEIDVWIKLIWKFGFWKTQIRTTDFKYAVEIFNQYKKVEKQVKKKSSVVLIHYG